MLHIAKCKKRRLHANEVASAEEQLELMKLITHKNLTGNKQQSNAEARQKAS